MARERDFQRSKVYLAESKWRAKLRENNRIRQRPLTLVEIKEMAVKILSDNSATISVEVRDGRARRTAAAANYGSHGVLWMPRIYRNQAIVLHEVAHLLAPKNVRHGPEFCRIMLRLVERYMGADEVEWLLQAYQAAGVRTEGYTRTIQAIGA